MRQRLFCGFTLLSLLLLACATCLVHAAPTAEVRMATYAENGTILNETWVTYKWMEANLPVLGDGITHYYHQGPVFEGDKWDPNETTNFKDKGAVKGTDIKDLCDLVGGMAPGDEVMIHAADGYHIEFCSSNVYEPQPRQGPIVLCWYCGESPDVPQTMLWVCDSSSLLITAPIQRENRCLATGTCTNAYLKRRTISMISTPRPTAFP
jgi:hypothetical protein